MHTLAFVVALSVMLIWTYVAIVGIRRAFASPWIEVELDPIPEDSPWVDAVVPARNEASEIGASLRSLLDQEYPRLRITVVDDQSLDETPLIVEQLAKHDERLKLVRGVDRPAGWVGKTWALQQGVETTSAQWLWFVDADMVLHPRALWTALSEANRTGANLVSLLGRPRCKTFWQASIATAVIETLSLVYPLTRVNDPTSPDALAHGAFMLVRREAHDAIGGMNAVRGEIIEDIQYARRIKASGRRIIARPAPLLSQTHMYGSFQAIWRGLRKNAYAGMDYLFYKYAFGMIYALTMVWTPLITVALGVADWDPRFIFVGLAGWVMQVLVVVPITTYLGLGPWWALSLPFGGTAYVGIITASVWHYHRGGQILWKDRAFTSADQSL